MEIIDQLKKDFLKIKFKRCIDVKNDAEELLMMSMCEHNIQSRSGFSKWATNFNTNPNKYIFFDETISKRYTGSGFCDYNSK